jgi:hypothetical protein
VIVLGNDRLELGFFIGLSADEGARFILGHEGRIRNGCGQTHKRTLKT